MKNKPNGKNAWTVKIGEKGIAIPPKDMMNKYISMIFGEISMGEEQLADKSEK